MQYISFRGIMASIVAILVATVFGKRIIAHLQRRQMGEIIRDLGLEGQMSKQGTPTMGGLIIILSVLVGILLFGDLTNIYVQLLIFTTVWLGLLGWMDDRLKKVKHNKDGLNGRYKILGQVILGLVVGLTICFSDEAKIYSSNGQQTMDTQAYSSPGEVAETVTVQYQDYSNTTTTIPFVKNNELDYKWLSPFKGKAGDIFTWCIYILMIVIVITACSNGANLTDGLDGLAAGVSAIIGTAIGVLAYLSGHIGYSEYLNIMYIPNSGEVVIFMAAMLGALLGFLWFNTYPAQVFMGDTGSLTLGGIIGVSAVIIRKELLLPILCGIFLVESLSVIIQRYYFKYTRKRYGQGRRVFKMTPLHHHFQKEGGQAVISRPAGAQHEAKIVIRFWIVSIILAVVSIITLKIR